MKLNILAGAALAAALVHSPASAQRQPSAHIRCDGRPDNVTAGETAARLLGAVTLLGIFAPPQEQANSSLRLAGAEGIAICNQALDGESNDVRRAELILATAVHQIEAGQFDQAIAEARLVATDRPALAATAPFQRSFALGAIEVEALALLGAGRLDEARARAFEMAAAAPYDIVTQLRAARFVRLAPSYGAAEQRFYDNMIRVYPATLVERAFARQMAGDWAGGAADYDLWLEIERSVIDRAGMISLAQAAIAHAVAGNDARAEELAAAARTAMQADPNSASAPAASEILDLYQIWKNARDGRLADARLLFGSRSAWLRPSAPVVAEVARLLQRGAEPGQLIGSLAGDPGRFRAELLDRRKRELNEAKDRFVAIRPFYAQAAYDRFAANVWRSGRSHYFLREDNVRMKARMISVARDGTGVPANYALLLHAALIAQAEGKTRFMLLPLQINTASGWIRFGNEGGDTLFAPMTFDAARVIADLGPLIPRPARR
jgi:hypothetical protein